MRCSCASPLPPSCSLRSGARVYAGAPAPRLGLALTFGIVLAVMNIAFYHAIARIPLGIAVAIEFLGPLGVAVAGSRRRIDMAWVALAAFGVLALTRGSTHGLDVGGVLLALLAGAASAAYILCNARMGREFSDGSGLALAMAVACVLAAPFGVAEAGRDLLTVHALVVGAAVGVLSSVIPYTVEMEALRRIAAGTFGVLMSLEPAVAVLAWVSRPWPGTHDPRQLAGIALVIAASLGASRGAAARADSGRLRAGRRRMTKVPLRRRSRGPTRLARAHPPQGKAARRYTRRHHRCHRQRSRGCTS